MTNHFATKSGREYLPASVDWLPSEGTPIQSALATKELLGKELYLARAIRVGARYPRQRNYHGFFYFSQTGRHVWHESLLEANTLLWLDAMTDIVAVAAQPFTITFADGSQHTPDYMALHADQQQVVYDVKPAERLTPKVLEQFAKTRRLCEEVGFGYQVCTELTEQVRVNLRWLNAFAHPAYRPDAESFARLLTALTPALPLGEAADIVAPHARRAGRASVFNLLWTGTLATDLTIRLGDNSVISGGRNVHA